MKDKKGEKMRKFTLLVTLLCLPLFYGFASIIGGTSQSISVNSEPSGADIIIDGVSRGVTPLTLNIKREKEKSFIVRKEGYKDQVIPLATKFHMLFWGNAFFGGLIGSSIDSSTGATIEYSPDSYYATLELHGMSKLQKEDFNKKIEVKNFILANYLSLTSDIVEGEGEYLSNLYGAFENGKQNTEATLKALRNMVSEYENIPKFAESVVDFLFS